MKKKKVLLIGVLCIITCMLFVLTGCNDNNGNNGNNGVNTTTNGSTATKKADHKIYKYVKMSSDNTSNLLYSANGFFNNPSVVSSGDIYYKPCIITEFDTETGKATKAKLYMFFLDNGDDESVDKALEKYNSSTSEYKKYFTNVQKGRINESVTYLSADLGVDGNIFTQYIDSYIINSQDIDKYKDKIYYSRLYNYSSNPPHEEGSNYFEETLEGIRIEWSDSEIAPLTGTKNMTNNM